MKETGEGGFTGLEIFMLKKKKTVHKIKYMLNEESEMVSNLDNLGGLLSV